MPPAPHRPALFILTVLYTDHVHTYSGGFLVVCAQNVPHYFLDERSDISSPPSAGAAILTAPSRRTLDFFAFVHIIPGDVANDEDDPEQGKSRHHLHGDPDPPRAQKIVDSPPGGYFGAGRVHTDLILVSVIPPAILDARGLL